MNGNGVNTLVSTPWARFFFVLAIIYLATLPFGPYPGKFLVKAAPIFLLLFPVIKSALSGRLKILLSLAVLFSAAGDIFLAVPMTQGFIYGLGAFLVAHIFFIIVNARFMQWQPKRLIIIIPAVLAAVMFLSTILDAVAEKNLLVPVIFYAVILVTMTVVSCMARPKRRLIMFGGLAFLVSDCVLAYGLFVQSSLLLSVTVMFFYYSSEFMLVSGNID